MKNFLLTIVLFVSGICGAVAQNNAMYIYRNDGEFNAFFKEEIDSITYSYFDNDSLLHDDVQMQVIHTIDSVYRIPVAVIDSVSFVKPQTIYTPNVRKLDDLLPYLLKVDDMTLFFSSQMPNNLWPHKNDVLIYEHFEHELLPWGFAGRVSSINEGKIICDSVSLSDIYEQLICFGDYIAIEDSVSDHANSTCRLVPRKISGSVSGAISLEGSVGTPSKLFLKVGGKLELGVRVTYLHKASSTPFFEISVDPTFTATLTAGAKGDLLPNHRLENKMKIWGLPIPNTPFYFYVQFGPTIEPNLTASLTTSTSAKLGISLGVKYKNEEWSSYARNTSKNFSTPDLTGSIDGSLFLGFASDFVISSYGNIVSVGSYNKLGAELTANLSASLLNSDKYEELSHSKLDLYLKKEADVVAKLQFTKFLKAQAVMKLWSGKALINSWKFLPSFQDLKIENKNYNSASIGVTPMDNLLKSVTVGIGLFDNDNKLVSYAYSPKQYRLKKDWGDSPFFYTFEDLSENKIYTAYPFVIWNGLELKAMPCKTFMLSSMPISPNVITGDVIDTYPNSAIVCGIFENVSYNGICGIEYGHESNRLTETIEEKRVIGEQQFSVRNLSPATIYYYRAFVYENGKYYYGSVKSFVTKSINCSVSLSNFKVTKSQYKEGGFTNDGKKYDFRFDTSVTGILETDDVSYIKEWGYVYEDPEGKTAKIPLSGTKETVTRYAYFRNSAHSTARLYGYAYIEGIDKPIYYEVHDFPLDHIMAVANTGECEKVTANSSTISCSFENVPEGAICGVEYSEGDNWSKQTASSKEGTQKVTLSGLKPGTKYNYRAFIDDGGQMYYGGQREFTTEVDLPDLTGTWSCTIYKDDGSVLNQCTFNFTDDHKVTQKGSNWIDESEIGSWSINTSGKVSFSFFGATGNTWWKVGYSGQVDNMFHPSSIEGKVSRAWGNIGEHVYTYQFKMTR